jgi:predicted transcriptional regulator YdeE
MEPRIVETEAFTVLGLLYRRKAEDGEIPQKWQRLGSRVPEIKNIVNPAVAYGVSDNMDMSTGEFD